jgi:hypothetical protein
MLQGREVDGNGSGSSPVAGFGVGLSVILPESSLSSAAFVAH